MKNTGIPLRKADRYYTYGDYRLWPDDERWELIEGVAYNMSSDPGWIGGRDVQGCTRPAPSPSRKHQAVTGQPYIVLSNFLSGKNCKVYISPFDVLLPGFPGQNEDEVPNVVQPDIVVICNPELLTDRGCTGAPDLAVEVLSPSTSRKDMTVKLSLYEKHGVREYWIVDAGNRYLHVYRLQSDGKYPEDPVILLSEARLTSSVLEGFSVSLAELFTAE